MYVCMYVCDADENDDGDNNDGDEHNDDNNIA